MLFTNKKRKDHDLNIMIDGTKIEKVKKTKFLGVIIDNKLSWKGHVAHVASKVSRGMGMIIKARNYLNRKSLLTLYYIFVYPYLTYCNHIWGNIHQSNLKHLCVLQNKILRIIAGAKPRESAGPLYFSLGILKLTDINKYLIARFMYKYCINMVPRLFSSFFLRNYNVSTYDLRSANCFHWPLVSTDFGKNGIRYRGAIVFNKLLLDGIDSTVSEAVFVNQLKRSIKMGILYSSKHSCTKYCKCILLVKMQKRRSSQCIVALGIFLFLCSYRCKHVMSFLHLRHWRVTFVSLKYEHCYQSDLEPISPPGFLAPIVIL